MRCPLRLQLYPGPLLAAAAAPQSALPAQCEPSAAAAPPRSAAAGRRRREGLPVYPPCQSRPGVTRRPRPMQPASRPPASHGGGVSPPDRRLPSW